MQMEVVDTIKRGLVESEPILLSVRGVSLQQSPANIQHVADQSKVLGPPPKLLHSRYVLDWYDKIML